MSSDKEPQGKMSRRSFLTGTLGTTLGLAAGLKPDSSRPLEIKDSQENLPKNREKAFMPFDEGIEWQYFQFEVDKQAVFCSMVQINDPSTPSNNLYGLSIRSIDLDTNEVSKKTHPGTRTFDLETSTYTFNNNQNDILAQFTYNQNTNDYSVVIHTEQFDTDRIDPNGLTFSPMGPLIKESRSTSGRFPIAQTPDGLIYTRYYSDNTEVLNSQGDVVGYGSRDSQVIEPPDFEPNIDDFDHHWIHTWIKLADERRVAIKAWESKTDNNFRFVTIAEETGDQTGEFNIRQFNEENTDLKLTFIPTETEEVRSGESKKSLSRSGRVVAQLGDKVRFDLTIETLPGQILEDETELLGPMVEAHGKVVSGSYNNEEVQNISAIWESTTEWYFQRLPIVKG